MFWRVWGSIKRTNGNRLNKILSWRYGYVVRLLGCWLRRSAMHSISISKPGRVTPTVALAGFEEWKNCS